jgi:hypothetical protein
MTRSFRLVDGIGRSILFKVFFNDRQLLLGFTLAGRWIQDQMVVFFQRMLLKIY